MWRPVIVTTAATGEPIEAEDAIAHVRAQGAGDDVEIAAMVATARAVVESRTGTKLFTQTVTLQTDDWADLGALPVAPVQSITSVTYTDTDGASQTLGGSVYEARLYGLEPAIVLKYNQTWPTIRQGSQIVVVAVVGYGAAGTQPPETLHAMRLIVADLYAFRETAQIGSVSGKIPSTATVDALLANHKLALIV
jgi:uncharacterized phiE125 gp8 family phage protein